MVFLMNGQIMDLVIKYVKGMLVRGSEEGFVIILSLLVVEELVNNKDFLLKKVNPAKETLKDRPQIIPKHAFLLMENRSKSKVSIYVKHYPVKVKFHFNLQIKMRNVSISISNDH